MGIIMICALVAGKNEDNREVWIIGKEDESQKQDCPTDDERRSCAEKSGD